MGLPAALEGPDDGPPPRRDLLDRGRGTRLQSAPATPKATWRAHRPRDGTAHSRGDGRALVARLRRGRADAPDTRHLQGHLGAAPAPANWSPADASGDA